MNTDYVEVLPLQLNKPTDVDYSTDNDKDEIYFNNDYTNKPLFPKSES
jgi:hypothetical protein